MNSNKKYMGFLIVDYEDGNASTYKGLILSLNDDNIKKFNTGDPLIDWYEYCKYIYNGYAEKDGIESIVYSSSVDHWFMDTDDYVEKFLKLVNDTYVFMTESDIDKMSLNDLNNTIKCVVNKKMGSFQELKNYYKQKIN